jgi:hypothetical protein
MKLVDFEKEDEETLYAVLESVLYDSARTERKLKRKKTFTRNILNKTNF